MGNDMDSFVDRPFYKILGWICTIASLLSAIYFACLYKKTPHFEYEIISRTLILNRNVDVPSIRIMIDSVDIQRDSLNISIMEIKISNTGQEHLRRDDYDNSIFGLKIINGKLLEKPEISYYSSEHILRCCKEHGFGEDSMFIPMPIIPLDSKDYYQFKLVICHRLNDNLSFIPYGKIIGQKEISVLENRKHDEPFWRKVFDENPFIHLFRFIIYLIILITLIWSYFFISTQISEKKDKQKEKKINEKLRNNKQLDAEVVDDYINMPSYIFTKIIYLIKLEEDDLLKTYEDSFNYIQNETNKKNDSLWYMYSTRFDAFEKMLEKGYIKMEEGRLMINQKKKDALLKINQEVTDFSLNKQRF